MDAKEIEQLEKLESVASVAARAVNNLIPDSCVEDDGAGEYVYIPVESATLDDYVIAFVPTIDQGEDAKWHVQSGGAEHVWVNEELDAKSDPAVVAEWVKARADEFSAKVNAGEA